MDQPQIQPAPAPVAPPEPAPLPAPTADQPQVPPSPVEPLLQHNLEMQGKTHDLLEKGLEHSAEQGNDQTKIAEATLQKTADIHDTLKQPLSFKLDQIPPELMKHAESVGNVMGFLNAFLKSMTEKGDKGDTGPAPVKGQDYWTQDELQQVAQEILSMIRVPEDGKTPVRGHDYFTPEEMHIFVNEVEARIPKPKDGVDGKDAEPVDHEKIIRDVLAKMPKPKDGKDGKDAKQFTLKEIVAGLHELLGHDRLSFKSLKDIPELFIGGRDRGTGPGYLREIADVVTTGLADGHTLVWSASQQKWVSQTPAVNALNAETINTTGGSQVITLAHTPVLVLLIEVNGQILVPTTDYTLVGVTLTLLNSNTPSGLVGKAVYTY